MKYKKIILAEYFPNAKLVKTNVCVNIIIPNPPNVIGDPIILGTGRTSAMAWKNAWENYYKNKTK